MNILHVLDNTMSSVPNYNLVESNEKCRKYRKKWYELNEISYNLTCNDDVLELVVPIGEVLYYKRFVLNNNVTDDIILSYLKDKIY